MNDDNDGVNDTLDCAPMDGAFFPGAVETCDDVDSDCDGSLVDDFADSDNDLEPDCVDSDDDDDGEDDFEQAETKLPSVGAAAARMAARCRNCRRFGGVGIGTSPLISRLIAGRTLA